MAAMGETAPLLEQQLETYSVGRMGILVRPSADQNGSLVKAELERAMGTSEAARSQGYHLELDATDHAWIVLEASNLQELMTAAQTAGETLVRTGIGERVIAGVIPFRWKERVIFWLYQPRLQGFTPFAPNGKTEEEERDHELEVRMAAAMDKKIPVVKDLGLWYPVWDLPF
jgi:hypothetical protein